MTKRCIDCRFFSDLDCLHPRNVKPDDPIYAELIGYKFKRQWGTRWTVVTMRKAGWLGARLQGMCGREARWFQPIDPRPQP